MPNTKETPRKIRDEGRQQDEAHELTAKKAKTRTGGTCTECG